LPPTLEILGTQAYRPQSFRSRPTLPVPRSTPPLPTLPPLHASTSQHAPASSSKGSAMTNTPEARARRRERERRSRADWQQRHARAWAIDRDHSATVLMHAHLSSNDTRSLLDLCDQQQPDFQDQMRHLLLVFALAHLDG